jgi:hypothetical protein
MQNSNSWRCFERLVLCGYISGYFQFPLIQKTQKQQRERGKGQNSMQTPYLVKSWKTSKKSYLQVLEKKSETLHTFRWHGENTCTKKISSKLNLV